MLDFFALQLIVFARHQLTAGVGLIDILAVPSLCQDMRMYSVVITGAL